MAEGDHVHITREAVRAVCTTPDDQRTDEIQAIADGIMRAAQDCVICEEIFDEVSQQIIVDHTDEPFDPEATGGEVNV